MKKERIESKLTLNKISIVNLEALELSQQGNIRGGGTETCPDPTVVPINCQP